MPVPLRLEVLDPTAGPATGRVRLAPRLETLDGAVLGAIWNSRPHGDKIIRMVVDLLGQRYEIKEFILRRKPYLGNIAPQEIFDELAQRCDAVITGVGDWGSCTSASLVDALTMEKRGIPAAVIATDRLVATTGKGMARAHGVPDYPFAVIEHPIESARGEEELRARAQVALPQVVASLTSETRRKA